MFIVFESVNGSWHVETDDKSPSNIAEIVSRTVARIPISIGGVVSSTLASAALATEIALTYSSVRIQPHVPSGYALADNVGVFVNATDRRVEISSRRGEKSHYVRIYFHEIAHMTIEDLISRFEVVKAVSE